MRAQLKNWRKVKLGEVVEIVDGYRGENYPGKEEFLDDGYCVFLDAKNVAGYQFIFDNVQCITEEKDRSLRKGKLKRNDFVLTTRGTVGNIAHYGKDVKFNNIRINSGMVILRPKKDILNEKFFYLFLISRSFKHQAEALKSGSAQPQLPIRDLKLFKINIPSLKEQEKIVRILFPLGDKIELNNKISQTLEQMAQAIFKHWFIDFKFHGYEKLKFTDSELGKVPEGWRFGCVKDLGKIVTGKTPSTKEPANFGSKFPFITIPDMKNIFMTNTGRCLSRKAYSGMKSLLLPIGTICVSCIATVGRVAITTSESFTNQQINSVIPKEKFMIYFLYFHLKNRAEELRLFGAGGTATLIINKTRFENLELIIPSDKVMLEFYKKVDPLFKRYLSNIKENQTLSSLRDLLLPKLMSGEIRI